MSNLEHTESGNTVAEGENKNTGELTDIAFPQPPESGSWITDYAWICGVVGALMVVACAVIYNNYDILNRGVILLGHRITNTKHESMLFALVMIASSMVITELFRLWLRDRKNFIKISPLLRGRGLFGFLNIFDRDVQIFWAESIVNYLLFLGTLGVAVLFFWTGGEYGYLRGAEYYQIWFRFIELAFMAYLIGGFPYVVITRAIKHDPISDRRDFSALAKRVLTFLVSLIPGLNNLRPKFTEIEKKATRALLVKLFFTPIMTVFFADQFQHLVNNVGYMGNAMLDLIKNGSYTHERFNNDLFNISNAFIFSIDVALAWCGYTVSSRWVDNITITAEPTILGWLVCICCYPPFRMVLGLYYSAPSDQTFLHLPNPTIVTIFAVFMVLSFLVYMLSTLWFGVRFSNLTNRGIIRKGPYAIVRHPAYASKNFSWWCVGFPVVIYIAFVHSVQAALLQLAGLIFMTWFYYWRAITEERHLGVDPYYREYCKQVKYRFIPRVI